MSIINTVDAIAKYENGIVIIERKKWPEGLALPGGHLEAGENLEDAIRREVQEETNLKISSMKQFRTYSDPDRDPRGHYISTVFECECYGKLKAGDDAKKAHVYTLDQIDELKNEFAFDHYMVLKDWQREEAQYTRGEK